MKYFTLFCFCFLNFINIFSEEPPDSKFDFIPAGLHLLPLKANHQEARFGLQYYLKGSDLKLDIGNNIDLLKYSFSHGKKNLTFGIEFMTYAYSTSYNQKRLQIDAVDGFFGGNMVYSSDLKENHELFIRFRVIHNSAHLVDGHYDKNIKDWIDGRQPIPYTKDFGELLLMHEIKNNYMLRYYGGLSYATLIRPLDQKKYNFFTGAEYALPNIIGKLFNQDANIFLAYHFSLVGIPKYIGNHSIMAGFKFGKWDGKGLLLYTAYYSGNNVFSEYFKDRVKKFGIGFAVDFQ